MLQIRLRVVPNPELSPLVSLRETLKPTLSKELQNDSDLVLGVSTGNRHAVRSLTPS